MNKDTIAAIAASQNLDPATLHIKKVEGGFTGATKYILESTEPARTALFVKVVDAHHPVESVVLETEAMMYQMLTRLRLTGEYFPRYLGYLKAGEEHALAIECLHDVAWGGPWTIENIQKLNRSINAVHDTPLTSEQTERIASTAGALKAKIQKEAATVFDDTQKLKMCRQAWRQDQTAFVNSRGQRYHAPSPGFSLEQLLGASDEYDGDNPQKLLLKDLNFGNLAIAKDRVYFVDPVYMAIGNPGFDNVVLGVNVLKSLGATDQLRKHVIKLFFTDKFALAYLTQYWIACTSLEPTDDQIAWLDFQQSCAETALAVWDELYANR